MNKYLYEISVFIFHISYLFHLRIFKQAQLCISFDLTVLWGRTIHENINLLLYHVDLNLYVMWCFFREYRYKQTCVGFVTVSLHTVMLIFYPTEKIVDLISKQKNSFMSRDSIRSPGRYPMRHFSLLVIFWFFETGKENSLAIQLVISFFEMKWI